MSGPPEKMPEIPKPKVHVDPWVKVVNELRSEQLRTRISDADASKLRETIGMFRDKKINKTELAINITGILMDAGLSEDYAKYILKYILDRLPRRKL